MNYGYVHVIAIRSACNFLGPLKELKGMSNYPVLCVCLLSVNPKRHHHQI